MEERHKDTNITMQSEHFISRLKVWWRQLRPHTLTAAFIPVLVGTALSLSFSNFSTLLFFAMLLASILIQSATNLFNEYFDFKRGLDNKDSVGIGGGIIRDGISPQTILNVAFAFFAIAILLGVYISITTSWWIAVIGSVCMAAGYFYTGGPYPIAYTPFGELVAGLFMGLVLILISFYIQAGTITSESIMISIPISILIGGILMANNIRDLDGDKENGRRTLAILLGKENAVKFLAGMFFVSYLWVIALILTGVVTPFMLLVILSIPKAVKSIKLFSTNTVSAKMMSAMQATAQMHTIFGSFLAVGLLLGWLF